MAFAELYLTLGIVAGGLLLLFLWRRLGRPPNLDASLRQAAKELKLNFESPFGPEIFSSQRTLSGLIGDIDVTISARPPAPPDDTGPTRITVSASMAIPYDLVLAREDFTGRVKKSLGQQDIELHTRDFDDALVIGGDEIEVIALLDEQTRKLVERTVVLGRAEVKQGGVSFAGQLDLSQPNVLVELVRNMITLAGRLDTRAVPIPTRLAENARNDPDRRIRIRNLTALQIAYPETRRALGASRAALQDRRGAVRMCGASFLGPEGNRVAHKCLLSSNLRREVRRTALDHLVAHLPAEELPAFLVEALEETSDDLQRAVIAVIVAGGHRLAINPLRSLLLGDNDPTVAAAARAVGELGATSAEPELLALIATPPLLETAGGWVPRPRDPAVLAAAIIALGAVGSIDAVESLLDLDRGDATAAARQIQGRLGDAGPGHLSVAEAPDDRGALSVAEQPGAVSLVDTGESDDTD